MKFILLTFVLAALCITPVKSQNCVICEEIVDFIENWMESNASVNTIEQYLEIVCTLAPDTWQQPCDALLDYGVEEAIQWIEENENASSLCSQLQLCAMPKPVKMALAKVGDANCDICIQVVGLIEGWVESNYTEQEIEQYLDQVCSLVPGFSQVCDQIVTYGVAYIVAYLQNDENATQICAQLGLCGDNSQMKSVKLVEKRQDSCSLCVQFMSLLKAYIGNNPNATVAELEQFVSTICQLFPQYSTICSAFADQEITTLIAELEGSNGPTAVCTTLELCSSTKTKIRLD
jgi:predicted component of type VI protein secretion system